MVDGRLRLSTVAKRGNRIDTLEALRNSLTRRLASASAASLATLVSQILALDTEIEEARVGGAKPTAAQIDARRSSLELLRNALAETLEKAPDSTVAGLAKQLADVTRELDGLKPPEVSPRDEIAKQRADRRAGAKVQVSTQGTNDRRPRGGKARKAGGAPARPVAKGRPRPGAR